MTLETKEIVCGGLRRIVLQNENGPCPLLAIVNAMILLDAYTVATTTVEMDDLVEELRRRAGPALDPFRHSLVEGLDTNPKFDGTFQGQAPELFGLFGITLVHGWVIEDDPGLQTARSFSYDQLMEKIVCQSAEQGVMVAQSFIESHPSQISEPGVNHLESTVKDGDVVILFRNNHYSTLVRRKELLVTLVTDEGFANYGDIVWESLDGVFYGSDLQKRQDCSRDEEIARQLQEEMDEERIRRFEQVDQVDQVDQAAQAGLAEQARPIRSDSHQPTTRAQQQSSKKKSKNCIIV